MGDREEVISNFTRWNYGGLTQASEKEDEAGYTEFGDDVRLFMYFFTIYLSSIPYIIIYPFFLPSSPFLFVFLSFLHLLYYLMSSFLFFSILIF